MKRIFRFPLLAGLLVGFLTLATGVRFFIRGPRRQRRTLLNLTSFFSHYLLRLLAINVLIEGESRRLYSERNVLIVANHLSYLDILVVASCLPSVFVTSVEMKKTPLLGALCRAGGSYFVERRNLYSLTRELEDISRLLKLGFNVVVFPEGTSSNGDRILPIKNSLLVAATRATVPIQPACLNYIEVNGRPVNSAERDTLFWYGSMSFLPHLWRLLAIRQATVRLTFLDEIVPKRNEDRKLLSQRIHRQLSSIYQPVG